MFKKFIENKLNQIDLIFNIQNGKKLDKNIENDPINLVNLKAKLEKHNENYMSKVNAERNAYVRESKELREKIKSMKNGIDEFLDLYNYCWSYLTFDEMDRIIDVITYFNMKIVYFGDNENHARIEVCRNGKYQCIVLRHCDRVHGINQDADLAALKSFCNNFAKMKELLVFKVEEILKDVK